MARFSGGGVALKLFQTVLYAILFCISGIILAIYSYFLSVLADRNLPIATWKKAVEGISGAAVLYLIFAVLLTCFLGGKTFFAFIAIVLDVLFAGGMVAIAVMTRDGSGSCNGLVNTPIGNGPANSKEGFGPDGFGSDSGENTTFASSFGTACRLNRAAFAVSIAGALFFLISALVQLFIGRRHQKEKRYGPSPANGYTSGSARTPFWRRRRGRAARTSYGAREAEMGAAPPAVGGIRPSHDTAYTGSTVAGPGTAAYDSHGKPVSGYHTAPTGTHAHDRPAGTNF